MLRFSQAQTARQVLDQLRRAAPRPLSIRQLSRRLGYSSDRALGMVLQGKRAMSPDMCERISKWARLTKRESEFLNLLLKSERKNRLGVVDNELELEIAKFTTSPIRSRRIQGGDLDALVPWYALTLLELIKNKGSLDAFEAQSLLRGTVKLGEVEKALEDLCSLGFLMQKRGRYEANLQTDEHLSTATDVPSRMVRDCNRQQLSRAADCLEEQSVLEREFSLKTFTVSGSQINRMKRRIREVTEELEREFLADSSTDDPRVVQLNVQFYQQSK